MEKEEIEKLKQEIKNELKAEIMAELKNTQSYSFDKYKNDVTSDDIEKAKKYLATWKWHWFIPIVCWFTWGYAASLFMASIDRGTLRVEYTRSMMKKFIFVMVAAFAFAFGLNLLVFVDKWAVKDAIKNAETKKNV